MRLKLLALLMILAMVLAACGGTPASTQEAQGGDEGGSDIELAESFSGATAASGTLSLNYPAGYTQSGTADVLVLTNTETTSGITVTVIPAVAATALGSTPAEILTASTANMPTGTGVTYSEPEEVTFGSNSGALTTATAEGVENIIAIVAVNDAYVLVGVSGPESADNRATLEAVAASITLE